MMQLKTLLGDYPLTSALKKGEIASDSVTLEFADFQPTNTGFKPMVREGLFDVSEMAIVTYLIAKAHQKPMVLLPAIVLGRFQHDYALYNRSQAPLTPADLAGKRVGIRSFTTTTGAWIRGILANDYRGRSRPRPLDHLRGAACRRIRRHHRAGAERQEDPGHAARRRTRRRAGRALG